MLLPKLFLILSLFFVISAQGCNDCPPNQSCRAGSNECSCDDYYYGYNNIGMKLICNKKAQKVEVNSRSITINTDPTYEDFFVISPRDTTQQYIRLTLSNTVTTSMKLQIRLANATYGLALPGYYSDLNSKILKGTTNTVYIPIVKDDDGVALQIVCDVTPFNGDGNFLTVTAVEDDFSISSSNTNTIVLALEIILPVLVGGCIMICIFRHCQSKIARRNRRFDRNLNVMNAGNQVAIAIANQGAADQSLPPSISKEDKDKYVPAAIYKDMQEKINTNCSICLEEFKLHTKCRSVLLCKHIFHANCIDKWLDRHMTCPNCQCALNKDTFLAYEKKQYEEAKNKRAKIREKAAAENQPQVQAHPVVEVEQRGGYIPPMYEEESPLTENNEMENAVAPEGSMGELEVSAISAHVSIRNDD